MIGNIIVAFSNLPCLLPIYTSIYNNDLFTAIPIVSVSLFSFVSHLIENHKHGMPGIGLSTKISYFANRLDVISCIAVILRMLFIYYQRYGLVLHNNCFFLSLLMSFVILQISEYDKYNAKLRNRYIVCHYIWHISIFLLMQYFLENMIYTNQK